MEQISLTEIQQALKGQYHVFWPYNEKKLINTIQMCMFLLVWIFHT